MGRAGIDRPSTSGLPIPLAIAPTTTTHPHRAAIVAGDKAPRSTRLTAANDNEQGVGRAEIDAALTRVAEAIGRHIAREHIRSRLAANDNEPPENTNGGKR